MNDRSGRWAVCVAAAMAVAGCAVGPDFHPPKTDAPATWASPTTAPYGVPATQASTPNTQPAQTAQWWSNFNDPILDRLVNAALQSNLDLKQAESRLREARAARGVTAADLWPTVTADGGYSRSHPTGATAGKFDRSQDAFQAGFDASWEIDVFGGTRRAVEAADADILTAVEDRRDVAVTLTAEVAVDYLQLRGFQQRIAIANKNLEIERKNASIADRKLKAGTASSLDTANATAQVAATESQIPSLEAASRQAIYALSVLLGRDPGSLSDELTAQSAIPATPPDVPIGLPSELLRNRPDIRRAEAQLHAATARVGVATSDLYPRFNLTGNLGLQGSQPKSLVNFDNRYWSIGPSVSWPIFDAGRIRSNINVESALQEQAMLTYQRAILFALQDTENALVAYVKEQQHRQGLTEAVTAYRKAVDVSTQLYTSGQTDFLNVLAAEGSLYAQEDALVLSNQAVATDLVALYKALGGGWQTK